MEDTDRKEFEARHALGPGVYWDENSQSYTGDSDYSHDCAQATQCQYEAWNQALDYARSQEGTA